MLVFPRLSLKRGFQNLHDHFTKILELGSVERYTIQDRYFYISDIIQGKLRNISYGVVSSTAITLYVALSLHLLPANEYGSVLLI